MPANPNQMNVAVEVQRPDEPAGPAHEPVGLHVQRAIYIQGGSDGTNLLAATLWAIPDANGVIPLWQTLSQTDLGQGVQGSAGMAAGSHAVHRRAATSRTA